MGVTASIAHVAIYGTTIDRFQAAADQASKNPRFGIKETAKSVQDIFNRLAKDFECKSSSERGMSGIGGEVGEADELLALMKD